MTVDEIQAAIDTIDRAIAAGAVLESLEFAEQVFTFRSIDDMIKARRHLASLLSIVSTPSAGNYRLAATSKGA